MRVHSGVRPVVRLDDARLAALAAAGDAAAFETLYERHHASLLAFCRHMLGNREDGEDALQQTFVRAHRALCRGQRPEAVRAWLFTIARNRCRTILAARRSAAVPADNAEPSYDGLAEDVQNRAELRAVVDDLAELPDDQRGALVMFELGGLSQAEIAAVVGCPPAKVKALVFQARSTLIAERDARCTPCEEIRRQLEVARGGALRRGALRRHLRRCEPCRAYRHVVAGRRGALAAILPVTPTLGLKAAVLGTCWGGGESAAAGGLAGGASAGAASGGGAATAGATAGAGATGATGGGAATAGATAGAAAPGATGAAAAGATAGAGAAGATAAGAATAGAASGAAAVGGLAVKAAVVKMAVTVAVAGAGVSGSVVAVEQVESRGPGGGRDAGAIVTSARHNVTAQPSALGPASPAQPGQSRPTFERSQRAVSPEAAAPRSRPGRRSGAITRSQGHRRARLGADRAARRARRARLRRSGVAPARAARRARRARLRRARGAPPRAVRRVAPRSGRARLGDAGVALRLGPTAQRRFARGRPVPALRRRRDRRLPAPPTATTPRPSATTAPTLRRRDRPGTTPSSGPAPLRPAGNGAPSGTTPVPAATPAPTPAPEPSAAPAATSEAAVTP